MVSRRKPYRLPWLRRASWARAALCALALALGVALGAPAPAAPERACGTCRKSAEPGWRFCPLDGTPLPPEAPAQAFAPTPPPPAPEKPSAPAPAAAPSAKVPAPAPPPVSLGADPAPTAPAATTAPALVGTGPGGRVRKLPTEAVDDLLDAIVANDGAAIRRCYRWESFFAGAPGEELEAKVAAYVTRLVSRARPTIEGRERTTANIRLSASDAEITIGLRDPETREVGTTYVFSLTRADDGWKVVRIRP